MSCCRSALVVAVFSLLVLDFAVATHFRGALVQWHPVHPENFDGQIMITHRIAWRRSWSETTECEESHKNTTTPFYASPGENLYCVEGCSGVVGEMTFFCTDFSILEDWVTGERSYIYNISTNITYFEASFSSCCWITTLVVGGGGNWNIVVKGDLTMRPDGRINSSPLTATTPIVRLQHGCYHELKIPAQDPDGDDILCRWAEVSMNECGDVCNAFLDAILDEESCTISYNATGFPGTYAVALQIEDFLPGSNVSLSSVPLQFLVIVFESSQLCSARPELVPGDTPPDGSCIPVELDTTFTASIVATSGDLSITDFVTVSPFGLIRSEVTQSVHDPDLYYINVTWTATLDRFGIHIFCFSATNELSITSNRSCITLLGGVQGPRIVSDSVQPSGTLSPSSSTVWSAIFDQDIERPEASRYIKVYESDTDDLVACLDVTSPAVQFGSEDAVASGTVDEQQNRTLSFNLDITFLPGQEYYILIDAGAAVGDMFCNQESHSIKDTSFWTFTIATINISPRFGNMLGSVPVLINTPLEDNNVINCTFGGTEVTGTQLNSSLALCVSPTHEQLGFIPFNLRVSTSNGTLRYEHNTQFLSISPEKAHAVSISGEDLLLIPGEKRTITWSSEHLLPSVYVPSRTDDSVVISIYVQHGDSKYEWGFLSTLSKSTPNDGEEIITIPSISKLPCYSSQVSQFEVCPVAIKVSVDTIGIWSGVVFLQSGSSKSSNLRKQCEEWSDSEKGSSTPRLTQLRPCPPNQLVANFDVELEEESRTTIIGSTNDYEEKYMEYFHPNIKVCYRQNVPTDNSGQQCCYNRNGSLVVGAQAGGSADNFSPKVNFNRHLIHDLVPYILCCKNGAGLANCGSYYAARPSGNEMDYMLPIPACVYGDPHIVTLDGHKYTFNGKGEFTLIITEDQDFGLQGRMEQAIDRDGNLAPGTVFTAIVATDTKNTVQFEVAGSGLRVLLNGEVVSFDDISLQEFGDVSLLDKGNETVLALFGVGVNVEITVENAIISVMLVGLPESMLSKTRGLMGTFSGTVADDLIPKGGVRSIPLDSSLEVIHDLFGITWIIDNAADSLFFYTPGTSWSDFYDPDFSPMFEPTFSDSALEEEAKRTCGDDESCLFDIAATKRVEVGLTTMQGGESFDMIVEMSKPITCDPQCVKGVCQESNKCSCYEGYEGDLCTEPIMEECEANFCENGGTCTKQVLTYLCQCTPEYEGSLCQDKVPPFHIRLINSSPRVTSSGVLVDFETSKLASSRCFLTGQGIRQIDDCSSGSIDYDMPQGSYILKIVARTEDKERDVIRRRINIDSCAVHLINMGIATEQNITTIEFVGTESVSGYQCRLDDAVDFTSCRSPLRYMDLSSGEHRMIINPVGCSQGKRLSVRFETE